MFRAQSDTSSQVGDLAATFASPGAMPNAIDGSDSFVTAEPTPKPESRRGWRRRRIKRGKS
ncbi:MAG: hypothetical protein ACX94B_03665 [Henriciella sp.]|nr:hypothetical protein [Hyphomonadaceae bacterium]